MIEYHNPEADAGVERIPYNLSTPIRGGKGINVAFLANGFPDSENFLHEVANAMQALEPSIKVFDYNKGNPTFPANDEMLGEITKHCTAAVAAYGH